MTSKLILKDAIKAGRPSEFVAQQQADGKRHGITEAELADAIRDTIMQRLEEHQSSSHPSQGVFPIRDQIRHRLCK